MGVVLTTPRPSHGSLNWDTTIEADLGLLAAGINTATVIDGTNANSIARSGLYIGSTLSNAPGASSNAFYIWVNALSPTSQAQIAMDYSTGALWTRKQQSGTWSAWRQQVDSSTDSGWVTTATGIVAAANFTLTSARYRILNGVVTIGIVGTRTTSAVTANANGIITPTDVVTLPPGLVPAQANGTISNIGSGATTQAAGYATSAGGIRLVTATPSVGIPVSAGIDLMGTYLL